MSKRKHDIAVFIGRFQPVHYGHLHVIDKALSIADNVLILVGSANRGRSGRNPFTYEEREAMIRLPFKNHPTEANRIHVVPIDDIMYNDIAWVEHVYRTVTKNVLNIVNGNKNHHTLGMNDMSITLIGHSKDHTSYYLNMFPKFHSTEVPAVETTTGKTLNSTEVRHDFFAFGADFIADRVPLSVEIYLKMWQKKEIYNDLRNEYDWIKNYKETVQQYPRIEHTVDAVVVQSGHVLLVRRRYQPGKGLLAMPGGYLNPTEKLVDGMIRELREETKIKVPEPVLRGNIKVEHTYDDPNRSDRGRIITTAFLIVLPDGRKLPHVKGSDDAEKAIWVPISDLTPDMLFEDHYFVIKDIISKKRD